MLFKYEACVSLKLLVQCRSLRIFPKSTGASVFISFCNELDLLGDRTSLMSWSCLSDSFSKSLLLACGLLMLLFSYFGSFLMTLEALQTLMSALIKLNALALFLLAILQSGAKLANCFMTGLLRDLDCYGVKSVSCFTISRLDYCCYVL